MGYTRYWTRTDKPISIEFLNEVKQIINTSEKKGIHICNSDGYGLPIVAEEGIHLNGNAEMKCDCEDFSITNNPGSYFCKTERKPYDYTVRRILKAGEQLGIFTNVNSDGPTETKITTDEQWKADDDAFYNMIHSLN